MKFDAEQEQKYLSLLDSVPIDKMDSNIGQKSLNRLKKKQRKQKRFWQSAVAVAVLLMVFIGGIRVSPTFASTLAQIPGLKPLVEMIALDKGIQDILINEYYEQINASQSINGKTVTITGVVADESGMIISYKFNSDEDLENFRGFNVELYQGNELIKAAVVSNWFAQSQGTYEVENTIDVAASQGMDYSIRDFKLVMSMDEQPEMIFELPFSLKKEIVQSKKFVINKDVIIDKQRFTIHELKISPIRTELKMSIDPTNTKKILSFENLVIYDESFEEWGKIRNGLVGFGSYTDDQFSIALESNYFRIPESITIEFREIEAIDKADEFIVVDFTEKKVLNKPESIDLDLEIREGFEIVYKEPPFNKEQHKGVFGDLVDAKSNMYHAYSTWFNEHEDYLEIGQLYDVENPERPPVSPVKIEITHYERYLDGIGRVEVDLD